MKCRLRPMTHGRFALSREWLISQASQLPLVPDFTINQEQTHRIYVCQEHQNEAFRRYFDISPCHSHPPTW